MFNLNDVEYSLVGASPVALTTSLGISPDTLNSGEIGLFTPSNVRILGANAAGIKSFKFAQNNNGSVIISDAIETSKITQLVPKVGSAPVVQIDYLGFNGSTGDIEEIADNNYIVTVYYEELFTATKDAMYNKHFRASTKAAPDKHAVAEQLVRDAIRNLGLLARDPNPLFRAELVSAGASSTVATGADDFVFTKGSKFFTATDIDNAVGGNALLVGGFIRIGTALTSPIYKVVAIDTVNNIGTLDTIYQGNTATIADTALRQVTAAAFNGGAVGVKMTGYEIRYDFNRVGRIRFNINIWNVGLSEFGSTLYTQAQGATRGVNASPSVAEIEYFTQNSEFGDNKYEVDNGRPVLFSNRQLVSPVYSFYNSIHLRFEQDNISGFRKDISSKQLSIFTPSSDPAFMSTATNGVRAVLATITGIAVPNP